MCKDNIAAYDRRISPHRERVAGWLLQTHLSKFSPFMVDSCSMGKDFYFYGECVFS